ncbi:aspartate--tRNA(Asn) ligase [Candidatus Bathyarchaeota archaeon B24-2]|nr:MAG: aspartate--tRNA(Asn) ligase [Candidatus Bathyarchaeota archaeon B24-2]
MTVEPMGDWRRTHYSVDVTPDKSGESVILMGWVQDIRDLGGITFIILEDIKGKVQITVPRDKVNPSLLSKVESLQRQFCIGVKGKIKKMPKAPGGAEVIPEEIKILNVAKHPLPLDLTGKTPAKIDVRLDARPLDLKRSVNRAIFKIQQVTLESIRSFLSERGFIEVHTPKIIASATEGGTELFPVAYFGREAFLAQSPQLYKEELTIAFEKVYEIATFFRAEESHTRRHLSEFVSIDIEAAFSTQEDVMKILEELIRFVCKSVSEKCVKELEVLNHKVEVPSLPFKRLTYTEVIEELADLGFNIPWGEDISTPAFRKLGEVHKGFYFITDWPREAKAFYLMPKSDDPKVCEAFDLMWSWIELASGGTRIHLKDLLIERLKEKGLHPESFQYHLKAFDYGMPPHAGWAIGLARLMMVLTGRSNIREVVLFPRDRFRLTP